MTKLAAGGRSVALSVFSYFTVCSHVDVRTCWYRVVVLVLLLSVSVLRVTVVEDRLLFC